MPAVLLVPEGYALHVRGVPAVPFKRNDPDFFLRAPDLGLEQKSEHVVTQSEPDIEHADAFGRRIEDPGRQDVHIHRFAVRA